MEYGDFRPKADHFITLLKEIARNTNNNACCTATTSAGTGTSVPAGFRSVTITQSGAGTVVITMTDGSVYTLSAAGQQYIVTSPIFQSLPAFAISSTGGASWQWSAIS
jgi:hypothetical protein